MSKSTKCAGKAATVLKNHCKKKTNKLVYKDYPKMQRGHCNLEYVPKISKTCGTRIRFCTAKELKMMAGPRLCECPDPNEPFKAGRFLSDVFRNAVKAAIVLGATYLTYDLGFWGVPRNTQATFAGICEAMLCRPDPCKRYEFKMKSSECEETMDMLKAPPPDPCDCDDPIPINMEKCCYKMKQVWNHTIIFIFEGIANAPNNVVDFLVSKWGQSSSKECNVCTPMLSDSGEQFYKSSDCELTDDYEDRYSRAWEVDDECKVAQEQAQAFLDAEEEEAYGESGSSGDSGPHCGY